MKTINFTVEESIYDPFKKKVDESGMRVAGLFKMFMRSYAEGKVISVGTYVESPGHSSTQEKRPVGRPPQEKEPEQPKPFKYNRTDPWSSDFSNLNYGDVPTMTWALKERGESSTSLTFGVEGTHTGNTFEDFLVPYYTVERPKYTGEEWFDREYDIFLAQVATMFILKNRLKEYRYDEEVIRDYASEVRQSMDNNMLQAGTLKENS